MRKYNRPTEREYHINGEMWSTTRLAEYCGISPHTARKRLLHYRRGEMTEDRLFRKGLMPPGGNYRGCVGNGEWRRLSDRTRPVPDIPTGTWEREHIKDPGDLPKPRRYVKVRTRDKQEPGAIYYNPCRINLG